MTTRASGSNQQIQYNYDNGNSINHNYGINKALTNQLCNIVTHKTTCFKNFHQFLQDLLQLSHDRGVPTETIKSSNKNKEQDKKDKNYLLSWNVQRTSKYLHVNLKSQKFRN